MSTKQLLAEIERGIKALQKAQALVVKAEAATPKAKATAVKKAPAKTAKATKVPAKKAAKGGMSDEGRAKIAAAQQKRWAKIKREKKKAAKAALAVPAAV
jgi:hypothetical protein